MYEDRFGLSGSPFRLNPDPKFFFGSSSHNKAMAYLHYGLRQSEGFIVITGEIGAGKSMLIGHLLDQLDRSNIVAANLPTSNLEPAALLAHILSAFRIEPSGAGKSAEIEALEDFLFDQMNKGKRVLLIVDEAQNLPLKTIEELRMLSNMAYDGTPLFQVFLIGQPEFRATLAKPDMEQLRQRVIATYHLNPLDADETRDYIRHRLDVVGWNADPAFAPQAFAAIHAATGGVPRKINTLCNRLFLYCALENVANIDGRVVATVIADMTAEAGGAPTAEYGEAASGVALHPALALHPESALRPAPALQEEPQAERPEAEIPNSDTPSAEALRREALQALARLRVQTDEAPPKINSEAPVATSMFDRLRALKAGAPNGAPNGVALPVSPAAAADPGSQIDSLPDAAPETPPEPATLGDLAKAIADAADHSPSGDMIEPSGVESFHGAQISLDADDVELGPTGMSGWRRTVLNSIAETRDDLKTAHANVARLRRRLVEVDRRRVERRSRVAANLDKAELILAEIRNVWR